MRRNTLPNHRRPMTTPIRSALLRALAVCGLGTWLFNVAPAAETAERTPAIALPPFVVSDTRELPPAEHWRYAALPGLEILSQASDAATQKLLGDFEKFRQALGYVWPIRAGSGEPTALILCDGESQFDRFIPAGKLAPEMSLASVFLQSGRKTAIVIDLAVTTLTVNDLGTQRDVLAGTDPTTIAVDDQKQLYREYVRCLLSRAEPRLPAWFEEGLAQIVMKMQFDPRRIEVGRLEDPNTTSTKAGMMLLLKSLDEVRGEAGPRLGVAAVGPATSDDNEESGVATGEPSEDRDFQVALSERALLPLAVVFAVPHEAPETDNPLGANRWAKESYAFVHMCLYGYKGKYRKPFEAFLARASHEPVTEAMFKDCFKASYKDMLVQLRSYCDAAVYDWKEFRARKGDPDLISTPRPLTLRDATEAEVGRIKGEALLSAGKKELARKELVAPFVRHHSDPDLLAALGAFEDDAGHDAEARKLLEAACTGKTRNPDAYIALARIRFAEAAAAPSDHGKFTSAQTTAIIGLLRDARELRRPRPEMYELMADTWTRSAATPKPDDVFTLAEGVQLFPGELKLAYETAALAGAINQLAVAHSLAEYGMGAAADPATKARFERLEASLPPEPPAPAPAHAK